VFIDLTGKNNANDYISHVGIVESIEGATIHTIEGNSDDSGLLKRVTRQIRDGYVIDFAPFGKGTMTIIEDWQRQWIETPGNH
jgi:hypothetical protein